jgi:hypothetical protein
MEYIHLILARPDFMMAGAPVYPSLGELLSYPNLNQVGLIPWGYIKVTSTIEGLPSPEYIELELSGGNEREALILLNSLEKIL